MMKRRFADSLKFCLGIGLVPILILGQFSSARAQGVGIGLYKDGVLVKEIGGPIVLADPQLAARAAAGDPAAVAQMHSNQRVANVRPADPSDLGKNRRAAFTKSANAEAKVRSVLHELKAGLELQQGLEALRAARDQLANAYASVQQALEQSELQVLQLGLGDAILARHDATAVAIEAAYQEFSRVIESVLANEVGALDEAIALASSLTPPAPVTLVGHTPTVQAHIEQAPSLTREAADALVAKASPAAPLSAITTSLPTPGDLAQTIEVQLTPEIINQAASLSNSPLAIYEFVRNKVRFQPYLGSRKGAVETLRQLHGNDTDQASLLLALLRASNIPCRYVRGTVEMTPDRAKSWLAVDDAQTAGSILTTAGMDGVNIVSGPTVTAIRCTRVWVEAYLPYSNYRGLPNDTAGKTWVPLDPAFTLSTITPGQDVLTPMAFDTDAFLADYISTFHALSPVEKFVADVQTYLNTAQPGTTVAQVERTSAITPQALGLLPASLPYQVRSISSRFSELEDAKRYKVRFRLYNGGTTFIDYTTNLSQIISGAVTIDYIGATASDQAIINSYGGIYETPPNLVNVKPRLKLDGTPLVTSTNSIGMGRSHNSDLQFYQPSGASNVQPLIQNTISAGNSQAIAFDTFLDTRASLFSEGTSSPSSLELQLHSTAAGYLSRCDRGQEQVGRLMQMVSTQDVSEAIVESSVSVTYSFGNPVDFEWTGLIVDADRRIIGPFAVNGDASKEVPYMLLTGYDGSTMENRIFEDTYAQNAISTIKILELSNDAGIPVYRFTSYPAQPINQSSSVVSAINAALLNGHHIIIPRDPITVGLWQGTGYIDLNPLTGAAAYIISGGISSANSVAGGATVGTWTKPLFCPLTSCTVNSPAPGTTYAPDNTKIILDNTLIVNCGSGSSSQPWVIDTGYTAKTLSESFGCGEYTITISANAIVKCTSNFKIEDGCPCATPFSNSEWNEVHGYFPNLNRCHTCKLGPKTNSYNCLAWAIGVTSRWVWDEADQDGDRRLTVAEVNAFMTAKGASGIAYYGTSTTNVLHFAKKSGGSGSACSATSKAGGLQLFAHDLNELTGTSYGQIVGGN